MGNNFYGAYHWEFSPVKDRIELLKALEVFCTKETNLFVETISPSLLQKFRFWSMRSDYKTFLRPDIIDPTPSVFHLKMTTSNLKSLRNMVKRDGLSDQSIAHIKGYSGEKGLFWFHGFCDEPDQILACSRHVDETTIRELETRLGLKAEKKLGELKTDRQQKEELDKLLNAMEQYQNDEC